MNKSCKILPTFPTSAKFSNRKVFRPTKRVGFGNGNDSCSKKLRIFAWSNDTEPVRTSSNQGTTSDDSCALLLISFPLCFGILSAQGLRSFGRLFSVCLPPFYAPYYVQLARDLNSLGVGIAFSVVTSIALTALFETVSQLEEYVCSCVMDSLSGWSSLLGDNSFSFLLDAASSSSCSLFNSPFVTSSGLDGIFVDQGMSTF